MADNEYGTIIRNGLWHNNPALVQILGLCPLLAVSSTVINALGLGIATTLTLVLTNLTVSLIRNQVTSEIRIPVFVMLIAAIVTAIELAMNAYFHAGQYHSQQALPKHTHTCHCPLDSRTT